ncbi:MAG: hypothetical protein K6F59_01325 [Gammaproteobacteria bacterium]|nr:hypothetical protein [Gammaproteobacteria bacterium]
MNKLEKLKEDYNYVISKYILYELRDRNAHEIYLLKESRDKTIDESTIKYSREFLNEKIKLFNSRYSKYYFNQPPLSLNDKRGKDAYEKYADDMKWIYDSEKKLIEEYKNNLHHNTEEAIKDLPLIIVDINKYKNEIDCLLMAKTEDRYVLENEKWFSIIVEMKKSYDKHRLVLENMQSYI